MNDHNRYDVTIIGGGIVGVATAYKLQKRFPELTLLLIEKEPEIAMHQSGHNSGVIHSGLYYTPGSHKAKNCVQGRKELVAFAKEHKIPHDICGKVIVATEERELPHMDRIFGNGMANDTEGIEKVNAEKIKEIEPHCEGIAGIWVPCTGIIDFVAVARKLTDLVGTLQPRSKIVLGEEMINVKHESHYTTIKTNRSSYSTRFTIFCGGLQSDRLAKKDGLDLDMKILGFRGDYYELTERAKHKVRNLIYPVPNPEFPFLGVHFTRMIHGGVECGPNAVFTFKREGYNKTSFNLKDTAETMLFTGTWKFLARHWKFGIDEYKRAFSKKLFLKRLQQLIPSLTMRDIEPGRAGVRAMALRDDGEMIDDFRIEYKKNSIHVLNAPSPAATACLAIGNSIAEIAKERFDL